MIKNKSESTKGEVAKRRQDTKAIFIRQTFFKKSYNYTQRLKNCG
jgi:mannose/fructose/N-acetylgalactosamine-specific phosphotransferase system component IID